VAYEGRMIAANIAYVSGYFSYGETYTYLTSLIEAAPTVVKELLDRADLSYLHAGTLSDRTERGATLHKALTDLQLAERRLAKQRPADKVLARRLKRSMFETRLKLAQAEANKAVAHIDQAKPYIFEERATLRWHLGRGEALVAEGRYQDAVDAYLNIVQHMAGKQLSDDETTTPVDVIAQARIGGLVAQQGVGVYARVDAALKPDIDKLVEAKDFDSLRDLQIRHPHSSLADNCFYEMARIITPQPHGELRAQVLLQSIIYRYPHSELLGETYAMLLRNCESSRRYRLGALTLQDIIKRHPDVMVPWEGQEWRGTEWAAAMLKRPDYAKALAVLSRPLPVLGEPLKTAWQSGKGGEVLARVISEESCFDRGIGLALDMNMQRSATGMMVYRGSYVRAFSTATGETLWQTKVSVDTSMDDLEQGRSIWSRQQQQQQHLVLCSGGIAALAHPEGIQALDLLTGRKLWSVSWERPAGSQPTLWFGNIQMDYRIRNAINPRPTFASDAGRFFYLIPDGTLVALDAVTGQELWRVKQPGFAAGAIGLMGDVVVTASVNPGEIHAYNIMDGRRLYRKPLPGTFQQPPAFDKARGRILVSDGLSLSSHNVADFRRVWHAKNISTINNQQTWAVNVLADGHVSVMCYNRSGKPLVFGHHLTMLDGNTGKRKWTYCATRHKRDAKGGFDTENPNAPPLFTQNRVLIPIMKRVMRREGRVFNSLTDQTTHVLDIPSGKKMGEHRIKLPNPPPAAVKNRRVFKQVQLLAAASAAEHLITLTSENSMGRSQNSLRVTNVANGSEVLVDSLPTLTGRHSHYIIRQSLSLNLTSDGRLLVPTGDGIRCYATASEGGDKP
jgi:outer membrane protein assembly factor BamB/tetratricopeptide (TPR) repeat protein